MQDRYLPTLVILPVLLWADSARAQIDYRARCDAGYAQGMRMVCGAPVRRYSQEAIARCEAQLAAHRERCHTNAAMRESRAADRRSRRND